MTAARESGARGTAQIPSAMKNQSRRRSPILDARDQRKSNCVADAFACLPCKRPDEYDKIADAFSRSPCKRPRKSNKVAKAFSRSPGERPGEAGGITNPLK